ncbi:RTA1 like protein-domain-containing protein [Cadophora sp. MPI-SDFR-AT-0126]|nr:RTA1 like protein-domain-containing protein [Leotiomycetes sp. MPI-SDFR-AT-0126]
MSSTADCKSISLECPVEATTYGYYPNLGANIVMVAIFAICAIAQIVLGIKYRLRAYPIVVFLGCLGETVGYVGRVLMHSNPWDTGPFIIQILLLIVSPSLLAAGIYLTLKHLVLHYGPEYSRLTPKFYTWLFVTCDAIGFLTQCIGGGIEASADNTDKKMLDMGNNIMVAGVTFQAVTMVVCGLLALDFAYSLYRHREERKKVVQAPSAKSARAFQFYLTCFVIAFLAILTRCIYRIPEMAGGWKNDLMRDEVGFMILDGA